MPVYWLALVPLLAAAWQDWQSRKIPDECVFLIAACGVLNFVTNGHSVLDGLAGLLVLGAPLFVLGLLSPSSIGGGDIKLCAALGLLLGPLAGAILLSLSFLFGAAFGTLRHLKSLPLAPFILPAYTIMLVRS